MFDSTSLKPAIIVAFGAALLLLMIAGYRRTRNASKEWADKEREWLKGEGAFFVRKGCIR